MKNNTLIIIPTYNESNNVERLIEEIDGLDEARSDLLFVDDNSPDGTGALLEKLAEKHPNISVIHRAYKTGLGSAYLDGFRYAAKKDYDYVFEMDADLSHDPLYIKTMKEALKDFDVVVASRFKGEWKNINSTLFRIVTSIIAVIYMRLILGLDCSDPMGGFVGYRAEVLRSLDYSDFIAKGYAFQAEVKYECKIRGFSMVEIPIIFRKRRACDSKISKKDVMEALFMPWKIRFFKKRTGRIRQ